MSRYGGTKSYPTRKGTEVQGRAEVWSDQLIKRESRLLESAFVSYVIGVFQRHPSAMAAWLFRSVFSR